MAMTKPAGVALQLLGAPFFLIGGGYLLITLASPDRAAVWWPFVLGCVLLWLGRAPARQAARERQGGAQSGG